MRKTENGIVAQSEESITLVTSCRLPHHDSRSFTFVQDDVLPSYTRTHGFGRRKELAGARSAIEDTRLS